MNEPPIVLVVEDNDVDWAHISRVLGSRLTLVRRTTLAEARAFLVEREPDCVLLDNRLPDGTGLDFLEEQGLTTPVVLLTAYGDERMAVQAMQSGACDYMPKHDVENTLLTVVGGAIHRGQVQSALIASQQEALTLRKALDLVEVGVSVFRLEDPEDPGSFRWLSTTEGAHRATGVDATPFIGTLIRESVPAAVDSLPVKAMMAAVRTGQTQELPEFDYGDDIFPTATYRARYVPLGDSVVAAVVENITELSKTRKELEEKHGELIRTDRISAVGRLGAGMAHELNQPLTGIVGYAASLRDKLERQGIDATRELQVISDQAARMGRVIENVRRFAGATDGETEREVVSVLAPMRAALQLSSVRLGPEVALETDFGTLEEDRVGIFADPNKLQQIFLNLFGNACDAVADLDTGKARTVKVTVQLDGKDVCYSVEDSGPGIPKDVSDKLFEPFYTTKREGEGTGLGLAISRGLVREQGGELQQTDSPLGGANFIVRLRGAVRELPEEKAPPPRKTTYDTFSLRVLVIDDEAIVRETLAELVTRLGCTVDEAANGEAGIEALSHAPYDVVFVDMRMPKLTGTEVARWVCKRCPNVRLYIMTGQVSQSFIQEACYAGAVECISKPFDLDVIQRCLRDTTEAKGRSSAT